MPATPPPRPARGGAPRAKRRRGLGAAMAITEQQVLDALRTGRDPDKDADIVSLGMVSGVVVRDGNVGFGVGGEPTRGARLEPLRKQAEEVVEALPGVLSVTAVLTAETGARAGAGRGSPQGTARGPQAAPD